MAEILTSEIRFSHRYFRTLIIWPSAQ